MNESRDEMIKKVRQEIEEAFADVPMPDAGPGKVKGFARVLQGREWTSLDAKFLKKWWSSYDELTPELYRYYLPALLTVSMEQLLKGDDSLLSSAFYELRSNMEDYDGGYSQRDEVEDENRVSLFSEKQYKAVCSFLEFGFDLSRYLKFAAASALIHRWNHYEHPAIDRAREFCRAMHKYEYPPSVDAEINALIQQICTAFDKSSHRRGRNKVKAVPKEVAVETFELSKANWKTIHPDFLANHDGSLTYFTDEEFRYFLPAYMIADLMIPEIEGAWSNTNVVFHLTHGFVQHFEAENNAKLREEMKENTRKYGKKYFTYEALLLDMKSRAEGQFRMFNQQERDAVVQFLRYKAEQWDFVKRDIDIALEKYWLKPVRQEIEDAFAVVPMPETSKLVDEEIDDPRGYTFAQALSGRSRKSLDADFLREWHDYFHYLSPKAYRYYFLAIYSYDVKPDYVELCATGRKTTHEYQTSLFDERQYKAACACVELELAEQRFDRASAFVHRWNRYEHPALERARAFYQKMHNFEYPPATKRKINEVIQQIRLAFDNTPYPDDAICEQLDNPEAARAAIEFRGVNWKTLHPDFVASPTGEAALSFFTDKAFRYFLPAYLIADLMLMEVDLEHDWVFTSPRFQLIRGITPDMNEYAPGYLGTENPHENADDAFERSMRRFACFNQAERDAIVNFLRYQMKNWSSKHIESALRNYWLKPIP